MAIQLRSIYLAAALIAAPLTSYAVPITYNIGAGGGGGFSASWLHTASSAHSGGYYMNGDKAGMTGTLTYDLTDGTASGSITGFGETVGGMFDPADSWTLTWTGVSQGNETFVGGETDLLSLDYLLSSSGHASSGTFYFADKNFAGDANSVSATELFLWGNNWMNETGADKAAFVAAGGVALGLDLYGSVAVPEPGQLALLAIGLIGIGVKRHLSKKTF